MMSSWLLFKSVLNCRWCDDPVICSLAPRSAACPDGSHHSWRGGQGAKFMWHWIHSGVRCFNRTLMESCPKPLKTLNVRFLCSRQNGSAVSLRVSQPQPLCDTILFANPLADAFSILFHMYCMQRKLEPPPPPPQPQTEQNIPSKVGAQLSFQHNLEHSLIFVFPLVHTVSDGRGRHGVDFPVIDTCSLHTHACAVSSFSVCVWADTRTADRGQCFFPLPWTCWPSETVGALKQPYPSRLWLTEMETVHISTSAPERAFSWPMTRFSPLNGIFQQRARFYA